MATGTWEVILTRAYYVGRVKIIHPHHNRLPNLWTDLVLYLAPDSKQGQVSGLHSISYHSRDHVRSHLVANIRLWPLQSSRPLAAANQQVLFRSHLCRALPLPRSRFSRLYLSLSLLLRE